MRDTMVLTAGDLMTRDILRVHASWPLARLVDFFSEHAISGAPVVSDEGRLIGVVSLTDVARSSTVAGRPRRTPRSADAHDFYMYGPAFTHSEPPRNVKPELTVRDIMTPMIFDVSVKATAAEIAETMLRGRIHRVFVTEEGMVIGVISALDMLRAVA